MFAGKWIQKEITGAQARKTEFGLSWECPSKGERYNTNRGRMSSGWTPNLGLRILAKKVLWSMRREALYRSISEGVDQKIILDIDRGKGLVLDAALRLCLLGHLFLGHLLLGHSVLGNPVGHPLLGHPVLGYPVEHLLRHCFSTEAAFLMVTLHIAPSLCLVRCSPPYLQGNLQISSSWTICGAKDIV